mmetsp:Transcript_30356/g.65387  ORF Transcript_30356/g.65387 Transcript_30356/m.65387 type:complete len:181 (+) Transcript_30356:303-845(+)
MLRLSVLLATTLASSLPCLLLASDAVELTAEAEARALEVGDECAESQDESCSLNALQRKSATVLAADSEKTNATQNSDWGVMYCGALICDQSSICCQSRDPGGAALCCSPGTACRFISADLEYGMNVLGKGSPRCLACTDQDPKDPGCTKVHGGSKYYGPLPPGAEKDEDATKLLEEEAA